MKGDKNLFISFISSVWCLYNKIAGSHTICPNEHVSKETAQVLRQCPQEALIACLDPLQLPFGLVWDQCFKLRHTQASYTQVGH